MTNPASAPHGCIYLLGAPGTGKTRLAAGLRASLTPAGRPVLTVVIEDNPTLFSTRTKQQISDLTLLMGLDLPASPADQRQREAADLALRDAMTQSGRAYQVVYGQGAERLDSALRAIHTWWPGHPDSVAERSARPGAGWVWACDNCSDPQCERRLLSKLLAARSAAP